MLPSGSAGGFECWSSAAASEGCASWSNAARAAPRNNADSRLTFQPIEDGPKMPLRESEVRSATVAHSWAMSSRDTGERLVSISYLDSEGRSIAPAFGCISYAYECLSSLVHRHRAAPAFASS